MCCVASSPCLTRLFVVLALVLAFSATPVRATTPAPSTQVCVVAPQQAGLLNFKIPTSNRKTVVRVAACAMVFALLIMYHSKH